MLHQNPDPKFPNVILVGVAGIIGVGKSTTLKRLKEKHFLEQQIMQRKKTLRQPVQIVWMLEPSDMWRDLGWLQEFYKDPDANAFWFQFGVFDTHVDALRNAMIDRKGGHTLIVIVERTMYCQRLFWDVQYDLKRAKKQQNEVYVRMWSKWNWFVPEPRLIFFLKTSSLDVAMNRVEKRAREGETPLHKKKSVERKELKLSWTPEEGELSASPPKSGGVTREYQQLLLDKHEKWYTQPIARPPGCGKRGIRCVHLETDQPFHEDDDALMELATSMAAHLVSLL